MRMYVYMYLNVLYMYMYMHMWMCVYMHVHVYMYVYMDMCICTQYMYMCIYVHVYIPICVCLHAPLPPRRCGRAQKRNAPKSSIYLHRDVAPLRFSSHGRLTVGPPSLSLSLSRFLSQYAGSYSSWIVSSHHGSSTAAGVPEKRASLFFLLPGSWIARMAILVRCGDGGRGGLCVGMYVCL